MYDTQQGIRFSQAVHCDGTTCCCNSGSCCSTLTAQYGNCRLYAIGNVLNQVRYFDSGTASFAIGVSQQVQARIVNNTIYECAQGVDIGCTYGTGCCTCPSASGSPFTNTRNTSIWLMNNVMLNMLDEDGTTGANEAHVRACTGPPTINEFILTNGDLGFNRNLHYGTNRAFRIPSGPWFNIAQLKADDYTTYGTDSKGDVDEGDTENPHLQNPAQLKFGLTANSPTFMYTGGIKDEAYTTFEGLAGTGGTFQGFPPIFHDYNKLTYSGTSCAIGAFGN